MQNYPDNQIVPVRELSLLIPEASVWNDNQIKNITKTLQKGKKSRNWATSLFGGGIVGEFEQLFSEYLGGGYTLGLNSATSALFIALKVCGIGPGDEVIVSAYNWGQVAFCIQEIGAIPVFADIEPVTANLDPRAVKSAVTSKTKALIVNHLYGHPANMPEMLKLCRQKSIFIIEDCAQGLGSACCGIKSGNWGDIAVFSFGWKKAVFAGEGGAIHTKNSRLFKKILSLNRSNFINGDLVYVGPRQAWSFRMHPLAAAAAIPELKSLPQNLSQQSARHRWFRDKLCNHKIFNKIFDLPVELPGYDHAWYHFFLRSKRLPEGISKNDFVRLLDLRGVPAWPGYLKCPLYKEPYFHKKNPAMRKFFLPITEKIWREEIYILSGTVWKNAGWNYMEQLFSSLEELIAELS